MPSRPKDAHATPTPDAAPEAAEAEAEAEASSESGEQDAESGRRALPEPIGTVRRELVRPDGKKVYVDVPVYPPFRLTDDASNVPKPPPRRLRPGAKPRKTGSD